MDADELYAHLRRQGISERVVAAMRRVPRDAFLDPALRGSAWEDHVLRIGWGQTISQPTVVAVMTEAVDAREGDTVLDVGTGSGYQAAVLAACGARVHGIERIPELAHGAQRALAATGFDVTVRCGDGALGWPERAPFDAVVVAAAAPWVPEALLAQLRAPRPADEPGEGCRGGRLVIPLARPAPWTGQELVLIERTADGHRRRKLLDVVFVPLVPGVYPSSQSPRG